MTGPEHYRAAESAFENAKDCKPGSREEAFLLAAAQFHASLAQAAATALMQNIPVMSPEQQFRDYLAWHEAAGIRDETPVQSLRGAS